MTSLYKIAEKVKSLCGNRGSIQEYISTVITVYAQIVKINFYEGRKFELSELDGAFIYTFKDIEILGNEDDGFYCEVPSTYLSLPHQWGVNSVKFMGRNQREFVLIGSSGVSLWEGLKSFTLGGRGVFMIENSTITFPKMTPADMTILPDTKKKIMIKLAVGLDAVDVRQDINIPANIEQEIVLMVSTIYNPKPEEPINKLQ